MSLSPSFTVSQNVSSPSVVTLVDTSTGSDAAIAKRFVYIRKFDGTYLVPEDTETNYIEWDYGETSIDIDVLDRDYGTYIVVLWSDSSNTTLYQDGSLRAFTLYAEQYYYQLTQAQTGNPLLTNDGNYYSNKLKLRTHIDEATQAIEVGGDITAAQAALDRAVAMINSQTLFF